MIEKIKLEKDVKSKSKPCFVDWKRTKPVIIRPIQTPESKHSP